MFNLFTEQVRNHAVETEGMLVREKEILQVSENRIQFLLEVS